MQDDAHRRLTEANDRLGRELAERLATNAEEMAKLMERAAAWHDVIALDASHPLHQGSAERAAAERRFAEEERQAASRWRPAPSSEAEAGHPAHSSSTSTHGRRTG